MRKPVLKDVDLIVGAILTNNREFTNYNSRQFLRIEEVILDEVCVEELKNKYIQHQSNCALVMPTNKVQRFQKIDKRQILDDYKLYNKYDICIETRWEICVGDALGCGDKNRFLGEFNRYQHPYYRVKQVYDCEVAVDLMLQERPEVQGSWLLSKGELIHEFHRISVTDKI